MPKVLLTAVISQWFDNLGDELNGGSITIYNGGTSTLSTIWTDSTGGTALTNPVTLDAAGREPGGIWVTAGTAYKAVAKNSAGSTLDTVDNIVIWGSDANTVADEEIDITFSYPGTPAAQGHMGTYPATRAFTFPANFAGSQANVGTAPSSDFEVTFFKNGSEIGTCTFAATSGTPTFATTGGATQSFVAGDDLTAVGPDSVGTAVNIGITLLADID